MGRKVEWDSEWNGCGEWERSARPICVGVAIMSRFWLLVLFLLYIPTASANDVISCDPTHPQVPNAVTRFERTVDFPETPGFLVWIAPNTSMTPEKQTYMNTLHGQMDSLTGVPHHYWICTDTNPVDG